MDISGHSEVVAQTGGSPGVKGRPSAKPNVPTCHNPSLQNPENCLCLQSLRTWLECILSRERERRRASPNGKQAHTDRREAVVGNDERRRRSLQGKVRERTLESAGLDGHDRHVRSFRYVRDAGRSVLPRRSLGLGGVVCM